MPLLDWLRRRKKRPRRARARGVPLQVLASYPLTRQSAPDLPQVVRFVAGAGLAELFVVHLDCPTSRFLLVQAVFTGNILDAEVAAHLDAAAKMARNFGIVFRDQVRWGEEVLVCALDPAHFAFIGCPQVSGW